MRKAILNGCNLPVLGYYLLRSSKSLAREEFKNVTETVAELCSWSLTNTRGKFDFGVSLFTVARKGSEGK